MIQLTKNEMVELIMAITREDIITYIGNKYEVLPEYTFAKFPQYCVFRHTKNNKWFALIMNVSKEKIYGKGKDEVDIIDLKVDPELISILKGKKEYLSAYHMNKEHWISVDLTAVKDVNELKNLIDDSFTLTKK